MVNKLFSELSKLPEVEAIALGGSRAGNTFDEKSDYDVYLYCTHSISDDVRKGILKKYCKYIELGNHFWEYEDNCTLNNGIDIDILYRNLEDFCNDVASVVEDCNSRNGYTTCMWHNLLTCKIIYDEKGKLREAKGRFNVDYPQKLQQSIIQRNMKLLSTSMPAYDMQIKKAVNRGDFVSINHRVSAFLESYFDIIFAVNKLTHPGEKRLVQLCKRDCSILPHNFESNLEALFKNMFTNTGNIEKVLHDIVMEISKCLERNNIIFQC
ncbi:MAG: DUF4037 domain-containing protein [Ruminococcus sp.]